MAEKEDELEIGTETDKLPPEIEVITEAAPAETKPAELTPEEGVADLRAKLEASERARAEAQQREAHARQVAAHATAQAGQSNLEMLKGSISQAQQNIQLLKARDAQLSTDGDHAGASEARTALAAWTNHLQTLQQGSAALEQQLRQPQPVHQPIQQNPVEALAATLTPASAAWLRAHPQAIVNIEALRGAHAVAVARHTHESPGYFAAIESMLGMQPAAEQGRQASQPQNRVEVPVGNDAMSGAAQAVSQRQSAPPAAPVSRTGDGGAAPRGDRVRMSAQEVEAAEIAGMTPNEYHEAKHYPDRYKARMRQKANGRATQH